MKKVTIMSVIIMVLLSIFIFTACNKDVDFTLSFEVDGEIVHTIKTIDNEKITLPPNPTKSGHIFVGWYFDKDTWKERLTANTYLSKELTKNTTVYARWKTASSGDKDPTSSVSEMYFSLIDNEYYELEYCFDDVTKAIVIPSTHNGKPVKSIGEYAFEFLTNLTSVTIPDSVTSIGESAFEGCESLATITIPNSVTSIGRYALYGTTWYDNQPDGVVYANKVAYDYKGIMPVDTEITLKDGTKGIAESAFYDCEKLISITIPDSVINICRYALHGTTWYDNQPNGVVYANKVAYYYKGVMPVDTEITLIEGTKGIAGSAFYGCGNLFSITIPDSVINIGRLAFDSCSSLTKFIVGENNPNYAGDGIMLFNKAKTKVIRAAQALNGEVNIPSGVTIIGEGAFSDCTELTRLYFYVSSLNSIGRGAFYNCTSLISFTISNDITSISDATFSGCISLVSIDIPNSVTSIGYDAFRDCSNLTSIEIPDSVTSIGYDAFRDCSNLTSIEIPDSVTSIDGSAFSGTAWYNNKPDGVIYINKIAYDYKGAMPEDTHIELEADTTSISQYAFAGCDNLASITIPNSVTSIGDGAFSSCNNLATITIPDSVKSIGGWVFQSCSTLSEIIVGENNPNYASQDGILYNKAKTTLIQAPQELADSVTIPNSVTSISSTAFHNCENITSITIPNSVISIGARAFESCDNLTSITIPKSVTSIGSSAFFNCSSLSEIIVDSNNPNYASQDGILYNKAKTTLIQAGSGLTDSVTIPNSVTSIGTGAFYNCENLTSITIPNSVTSISNLAFSECYSLTSVIIGNGVTSIGYDAFYNCNNLTLIVIPQSVKIIYNWAFTACYALTDVYYGADADSWNLIIIKDNNYDLTDADRYYYSETEITGGTHWRFVDGVPTVWA